MFDSEDHAASFYLSMRRIRNFEEAAVELHKSGDIVGSMHLCNGQEAIPVGTAAALDAGDTVTATYRGHGWAIAKGVPLAQMFAELMGRNSALCGGRGGSAYLSSAEHDFIGENSIVGAGLPIAAGVALAEKYRGTGAVAVVTLGDGALNQGGAHEALNMAAVLELPLVVIVENNVYSELTPIRDMVKIDNLSERASAYGMPGVSVNGRSPAAVADAVATSVAKARAGEGPSLIEAHCDRLVGHYHGDAQTYRPSGELEAANSREPLRAMRAEFPQLSSEFDTLDRQAAAEVERAVSEARAMPEAGIETLGDHLYA